MNVDNSYRVGDSVFYGAPLDGAAVSGRVAAVPGSLSDKALSMINDQDGAAQLARRREDVSPEALSSENAVLMNDKAVTLPRVLSRTQQRPEAPAAEEVMQKNSVSGKGPSSPCPTMKPPAPPSHLVALWDRYSSEGKKDSSVLLMPDMKDRLLLARLKHEKGHYASSSITDISDSHPQLVYEMANRPKYSRPCDSLSEAESTYVEPVDSIPLEKSGKSAAF